MSLAPHRQAYVRVPSVKGGAHLTSRGCALRRKELVVEVYPLCDLEEGSLVEDQSAMC